ncbi:MAG: hypothetical protein Q8N01_01715 [Sulfuricurvum sp.]|nr:hypothetical protein [Sulfuricurvum sp.]
MLKKPIEILRQDLASLKEAGQTDVQIEALLNLIDTLQSTDTETIEKSLQRDLALERVKHTSNAQLELYKSIIQSGQNAMKTALLINAGAAVSMLTFLTKVMTDKNEVLARTLSDALLGFVIGILCAALSTGTTYFTQDAYSCPSTLKRGDRFNILSILLVSASYLSFAIASYITYSSLR